MTIEPIAVFRSPLKEKFGLPRQAGLAASLRGTVELQAPYNMQDALRGLEEFDYIWLIWGFSLNRPRHADAPERTDGSPETFEATVRPPRLGGNRRIGVFASRSPFRPNGLGLSAVAQRTGAERRQDKRHRFSEMPHRGCRRRPCRRHPYI